MKANKKININGDWCKGCGICVEFCPVSVLQLENDRVILLDSDKCTRCGLCELRCPDYAIYLEVIDDDDKISARQ